MNQQHSRGDAKSRRKYIFKGCRIKLIGYINREFNYLKAFMLALSSFSNKSVVIFENKAKLNRAERRKKTSEGFEK